MISLVFAGNAIDVMLGFDRLLLLAMKALACILQELCISFLISRLPERSQMGDEIFHIHLHHIPMTIMQLMRNCGVLYNVKNSYFCS